MSASCVHAQKKKPWYRDVKGFVLTMALTSAASAFDIETSQHCFREFPGQCVEGDPLMGQRRRREYGENEAFDFAASWWMHRMRTTTKWWWTPQIVPEAEHIILGVHNLRAHLSPVTCASQNGVEVCSGGELEF